MLINCPCWVLYSFISQYDQQMHYLANVPGIEHFLANKLKSALAQRGGGDMAYGQMHYLANVPGGAKKVKCVQIHTSKFTRYF